MNSCSCGCLASPACSGSDLVKDLTLGRNSVSFGSLVQAFQIFVLTGARKDADWAQIYRC